MTRIYGVKHDNQFIFRSIMGLANEKGKEIPVTGRGGP
jgi:hypothetical protein